MKLDKLFGILLGSCAIDLDARTGKYSPFILKNSGDIAYPEGSRTLTFGNGKVATLFCHGTPMRLNYLSLSTWGLSESSPKSIDLTCKDGEFTNGPVSVSIDKLLSVTCTRIMEPLIEREEGSDCSQGLGADGRTEDLSSIVLVKIGWDFGNGFQTQISACTDEKVYGTLWTQHSVLGKSIEFRDKESGRPSFRVDTRGFKRFFTFTTATNMGK